MRRNGAFLLIKDWWRSPMLLIECQGAHAELARATLDMISGKNLKLGEKFIFSPRLSG